jgi:hypothetical protein
VGHNRPGGMPGGTGVLVPTALLPKPRAEPFQQPVSTYNPPSVADVMRRSSQATCRSSHAMMVQKSV